MGADPAARATVAVQTDRRFAPSRRDTTLSADDGRFRLLTDQPPPWLVAIEHDGSRGQYQIFEPTRPDRRIIDIGDLELGEAVNLWIAVRSGDGQPVAARIEVAPEADRLLGRPAHATRTQVAVTKAGLGRVHVLGSHQSLQLTVHAPGYQSAKCRWHPLAPGDPASPWRMDGDRPTWHVALAPGTDVHGTVRMDASGGRQPLVGALVSLVSATTGTAGEENRLAMTDSRGRFSILGVARKNYRAVVWTDVSDPQPLFETLLPRLDQPRVEHSLVLTTSRLLRIRLVDRQSGQPLAGSVSLARPGFSPFLRVGSDAGGRAALPIPASLRTEDLQLVADHPGYADAAITIQPGEPERSLRLRAHARVTGRLMDRAGRPIAAQAVHGRTGPTGLATTIRAEGQTAHDGQFEVTLAPGTWRLTLGESERFTIAEGLKTPPEARIDLGTIQVDGSPLHWGESSDRRE